MYDHRPSKHVYRILSKLANLDNHLYLPTLRWIAIAFGNAPGDKDGVKITSESAGVDININCRTLEKHRNSEFQIVTSSLLVEHGTVAPKYIRCFPTFNNNIRYPYHLISTCHDLCSLYALKVPLDRAAARRLDR